MNPNLHFSAIFFSTLISIQSHVLFWFLINCDVSPGPPDEDPTDAVPECVYVPGLLLQDVRAPRLSARRWPDGLVPRGSELPLRSLHHEHVRLHLWESAARLLHEARVLLLLDWRNRNLKDPLALENILTKTLFLSWPTLSS